MKWLSQLFSGPAAATGNTTDALAMQREVQSLRLELEESKARISTLQVDLQRARHDAGARVDEVVDSRIERFLSAAAGPASQLVTQAHLMERENKPVQSRDVLAVAKRLVKNLEELNMRLDGKVGEVASFDPDRHAPLGDVALQSGEQVTVHFVAVRYNERIIRKAGVEKVQTG